MMAWFMYFYIHPHTHTSTLRPQFSLLNLMECSYLLIHTQKKDTFHRSRVAISSFKCLLLTMTSLKICTALSKVYKNLIKDSCLFGSFFFHCFSCFYINLRSQQYGDKNLCGFMYTMYIFYSGRIFLLCFQSH